jgi:hypothetical protein
MVWLATKKTTCAKVALPRHAPSNTDLGSHNRSVRPSVLYYYTSCRLHSTKEYHCYSTFAGPPIFEANTEGRGTVCVNLAVSAKICRISTELTTAYYSSILWRDRGLP